MTDTERLDWLEKSLRWSVLDALWKRGHRMPLNAPLRETIDACAKDEAFATEVNTGGTSK